MMTNKKNRRPHSLTGLLSGLLTIGLLAGACSQQPGNQPAEPASQPTEDTMIYGLACDGSSDSAIIVMQFVEGDNGDYVDPLSFNIVRATRARQVFGHPEIGDWVGVMLNPDNPHEASMVVDLDQLKGTWTYQVLPTLKESATKSTREIEAELTDSLRQLIFIPREYGFTLKRQHQASPVGTVYKGNSLSDESLVEYPPIPNYTAWHTKNGRLILTGDTADSQMKRLPEDRIKRDTAQFVYLLDDSLVLRIGNQTIGYHRQANAREANRKAREAAQKQASGDTIK